MTIDAFLADAADNAVKWTDVASTLISAAAVMCTLATVWFVVRQDRCQSRQSADMARQTAVLVAQAKLTEETNRFALYQNTMREMQQISQVFLGAPELRGYFYGDRPLPGAADVDLRARVEVVSEMFVDFMAFTVNTFGLFSAAEKQGWTAYFTDVAGSSPAIRAYWRGHRQWYERPVQEVLDPVVDTVPDDSRLGEVPRAS